MTSSGDVSIASAAGGASGSSGSVSLRSGAAAGGSSGSISLESGASSGGHGGSVSIAVGSSATSGAVAQALLLTLARICRLVDLFSSGLPMQRAAPPVVQYLLPVAILRLVVARAQCR